MILIEKLDKCGPLIDQQRPNTQAALAQPTPCTTIILRGLAWLQKGQLHSEGDELENIEEEAPDGAPAHLGPGPGLAAGVHQEFLEHSHLLKGAGLVLYISSDSEVLLSGGC